jgi:hypothetical protein
VGAISGADPGVGEGGFEVAEDDIHMDWSASAVRAGGGSGVTE